MAVNAMSPGAALAAVWEHLMVGVPGGWAQRTLGAVGGVTGIAVPTLNGVWAYGEDAGHDAVLALLERVVGAGVPHCLQLSPRCSGELRELAQVRGMLREAELVPLMVLPAGTALPQPDQGSFTIELLSPRQAAIHAEIAAAGFQAPVDAFLSLMTPAVLSRPGVRAYVGKVDGESVATGVGVSIEDHVAIFNVATLAAHRRNGYGAAVTARAVLDGLDRGAQWAWLQSSPAGYPVYEKLGFRTSESWECWIAT